MGIFEAIILGIVQGATEFLPVSSSGHLVLVPSVFGFDKAPFAFDVLVQVGTLVAVVVYYRRRLLTLTHKTLAGLTSGRPFGSPEARFAWYVVVATIPAAAVGMKFKDVFEQTFASPQAAFGFLLLTAALLVIAEMLSKRSQARRRVEDEMTLIDAVVVGLFQAMALFPGVSRSGSTIAGGMLRGLRRESAANFSFIMSIPVMLGAGILTLKDLIEQPDQLSALAVPIAVGFVVSALTGYVAIWFCLKIVKEYGLLPFAGYCLLVGALGLAIGPTEVRTAGQPKAQGEAADGEPPSAPAALDAPSTP
jgi:undecaprenyl-diphosphatase